MKIKIDEVGLDTDGDNKLNHNSEILEKGTKTSFFQEEVLISTTQIPAI